MSVIEKTCPRNVYPLRPHFYIAKLGYAGVYLFFLVLLRNIDCEYSLERVPTMYVLGKNKKNIKIFPVEATSIFLYIARACFRNVWTQFYDASFVLRITLTLRYVIAMALMKKSLVRGM